MDRDDCLHCLINAEVKKRLAPVVESGTSDQVTAVYVDLLAKIAQSGANLVAQAPEEIRAHFSTVFPTAYAATRARQSQTPIPLENRSVH